MDCYSNRTYRGCSPSSSGNGSSQETDNFGNANLPINNPLKAQEFPKTATASTNKLPEEGRATAPLSVYDISVDTLKFRLRTMLDDQDIEAGREGIVFLAESLKLFKCPTVLVEAKYFTKTSDYQAGNLNAPLPISAKEREVEDPIRVKSRHYIQDLTESSFRQLARTGYFTNRQLAAIVQLTKDEIEADEAVKAIEINKLNRLQLAELKKFISLQDEGCKLRPLLTRLTTSTRNPTDPSPAFLQLVIANMGLAMKEASQAVDTSAKISLNPPTINPHNLMLNRFAGEEKDYLVDPRLAKFALEERIDNPFSIFKQPAYLDSKLTFDPLGDLLLKFDLSQARQLRVAITLVKLASGAPTDTASIKEDEIPQPVLAELHEVIRLTDKLHPIRRLEVVL